MASETNDLALQTLGVEHRSLPKTGKKDAQGSHLVVPATAAIPGGEGRISLLKRRYGWRRRPAWLRTGQYVDWWGAITHNLTKYARPDRHGGVTLSGVTNSLAKP